ncbi:MAG: FeoA family protein [Candidatus Aminicenantales bacterium]
MKKGKEKQMSIIDLKNGQKGKIVNILGGLGVSRKLGNMGIRIGSQVCNLSGNFMKGPIVVQSGRTQVAIGQGLAGKIMIEKI